MLNSDEIRRYGRHIVLKDIGGAGQQKLKQSKVLVIGAGGLGSPVVAYLAAAGVGTISVVDDDRVSLSNLQRQIVHRTRDVGTAKVLSARRFVREINPHTRFHPIERRLDELNGTDIVSSCDLVVDGSDNFDTRSLTAKLCASCRKPLVAGAVSTFDGTLTVFKPYEGENPRFCDLYPRRPAADQRPCCEEMGVPGPAVGVIGALQAMEVIKLVTNVGEPLVGRLLMYDGRDARFREITYERS